MHFSSIFAGKMLGDGYMNCGPNRAPRFAFLHALADKGYADYCYSLLVNHLEFGNNCMKEYTYFDKRTQKNYYRIYYQSKTSDTLNKLYFLWYKNSRRIIPCDWVESNFTEEGLAIWYQDDGSIKKSGNRIILSTESFSANEKNFLKSLLDNKFGIKSNIDIQGRLDISSCLEVRKFQSLVEPLIHPCMKRKSMEDKWEEWNAQWEKTKICKQKGIKRSTVYLPYDLYNNIRGKGYSQYLNNLLDQWLDEKWSSKLIKHSERYDWLLANSNIEKGKYMLTPRFYRNVKDRLDLFSKATGLEISQIITIALGN